MIEKAAKPAQWLRVLYSFPHRIGMPGIGTIAWHQVQGLVGCGVDVHLACASQQEPVKGLVSIQQTLKLGWLRIPHRAFGNVDRAMAWHDLQVARRLRRLRDSIDLVHVWPSGSLSTLRTARALRIPTALERPNAHTRYVYEVSKQIADGLGLQVPHSSYTRTNIQRLKREESEFDLADCLLCPSDFVIETFRKYGYKETLERHQYGYDPERFWLPDRMRQPTNLHLRVAYVGLCAPHKGLHVALDAWFRSGAAERGRFLICGRFEPAYREILAERLAHPSVEVLGFREDVGEVLRSCDALVLSAAAEGSALVGYEARGSGCVVLVSSSSGIPCTHGKDAFVHEVGDVEGLAGHIAALDRDQALLERLRRASIDGLDELTWAAAARRLTTIYQEMIAK